MNYNLSLNDEDMKILNEALISLPFKVVAPLINKINAQITNIDKVDND